MSIYYNQGQTTPPRHSHPTRNSQQYSPKLSPLVLHSSHKNGDGKLQGSKSPNQRVFASPLRRSRQQGEWEDIANVRQPSPLRSILKKQTVMQKVPPIKEKSPPKERVKDKLALIVNYLEEEDSVAQLTHYQHGSGSEDELSQSAQTVQSNQRQQKKSLPRKQPGQLHPAPRPHQGRNQLKNRDDRLADDELALEEKPKQIVKSRPKYLFYNVVEEQAPKQQESKQKAPKAALMGSSSKHQQPVMEVVNEPDYEYQKGVHPPKETKKERLKNKLGFIVDLFHRSEDAASVSYYSESNSQKQSMEMKPKEPLPSRPLEPTPPLQNIFDQNQRDMQEEQQRAPQQKIHSDQPPIAQSNGFEELNLSISPIQRVEQPHTAPSPIEIRSIENIKQIPVQSALMKIKRSTKINSSLERIEMQMAANRNRSRSKLSVTKSVENKSKVQRYDSGEEDQEGNIRPKKQSVGLRDLSRHIQKSVNKQSSNEDPQEQLLKSKSASSKFSMKLMEIQLQKSSEKQKSISHGQPESPKPVLQKSKREDEAFEDQITVKKQFPIARKISLPKNNSNFSKYMKINFNDAESNQNDPTEEIPSIVIKKTDPIQRSRPLQLNKNTAKIPTNANTGEETNKMSAKPINKVEFSIDRAKRFNTETIQQDKEQLSEQEKKFLALLKKREEALMKRVKEQVLNNTPSMLLKGDLEERSKGFSNQTFEKIQIKEDSSSNRSPKNYFQAERREKMSLKSEPKEETKPFFPTLNMKQPNFETFYNQNPIKHNNSKNISYVSPKKKGLTEPFSSDSEPAKTEERMDELRNFRKQPSKISYYNVKKLHREASLNEKNLSSRDKYERLKKLLEQV